jgi:hypothetical protein
MVFALIDAEPLPRSTRQLPERSGEPSRTVNAVPVDALFARLSERMIFAGASQDDWGDSSSDATFIPASDGCDAVDPSADFIPADSVG